MTACVDQLDVQNLNNQTTYDFGKTESDLQEAVISCYNRIRLSVVLLPVSDTRWMLYAATKCGTPHNSGIWNMITSPSGYHWNR